MAEVVQVRAALWRGELGEDTGADASLEHEAAPEAIDPVCGMTVQIAGARHSSEYDGRTWYFCGGGCKARFEDDPTVFAVIS